MLGKLNSRSAPDGSANIYSYGINARGRMSTVTLGGTQIAAYTYDQSEQRIIKTAANQTTHYHYDTEGRLIAETDGATGETIRAEWPQSLEKRLQQSADIGDDVGFYIVLNSANLQPLLKSIHRIDFLTLRVSALRYARAASDALAAQIADWDGNVAFREDKITEMQAQLATLSGKKAEKLAEKIARWEGMITSTEAKIGDAEAELTLLDTQITDTQTALTAQQALCDGSGPVTSISGTYYLHADHLGRPQFATDADGAVVWDMGDGVTPFGEGVNLAGAFAQKLMFPGQYADAETGAEITLSHNWHRTYDPTLGRYLQSDPIGLAGGLNRYAYVGGNPVGYFDYRGLDNPGIDGRADSAAGLARSFANRPRPDFGDTSICGYYETMASENQNCDYFPAAAKICRGNNSPVNIIMSFGLGIRNSSSETPAATYTKIRKELVSQDKKTRQAGFIDGNGCTCGDNIDAYHNKVWKDNNLPYISYGGNISPQWFPLNPVPTDWRVGDPNK